MLEKLFNVDDVVQVGQTVAVIEIEGGADNDVAPANIEAVVEEKIAEPKEVAALETSVTAAKEVVATPQDFSATDKFYSPLVKNIAKEEGIAISELDAITGTGKEGRVTKNDIFSNNFHPMQSFFIIIR